ncbi:hypothetical protein H0H93_002819 [Arthromyces matolae]|nr:hypothetical protein H0H93_002819 [Arthromyces matolae]
MLSISLPPEIYCIIFRLATNADEALDTSFDAVQGENRDILLPRLRDSIRFKATLSMVSKEFHWIMETLLYEVILITQFVSVPVLLKHLRSNLHGSSRPKGHACRRLDIHLGTWGDGGYVDEAWYEGGHTFWGLIPACPRLEILIARVNYRKPGDAYLGPPHLTHNALWKTISTYCAGTLRRLELFGFSIRLDRIELMLRYMSNLEVCDISHCADFDARYLPQDYLERTEDLKPQFFDEEEPEIRKLSVSVPYKREGTFIICCRRIPSYTEVTQSRHIVNYQEPCHSFPQCYLDEFEEAERNATWPPLTGDGPPYLLPKIHTLHFSLVTYRFFHFTMPSLKSLHIECLDWNGEVLDWGGDLLFSITNPPVTYLAYGGLIPTSANHDTTVVEDGLIFLEHPFTKKVFTAKVQPYPQPDRNETLFGRFPNSLTHLRIAYLHLPLIKVLHFFPNIISLTWEGPWLQDDFEIPAGVTNVSLRFVTIDAEGQVPAYGTTELLVEQLLNAARDAFLVSLKDVKVLVDEDSDFVLEELSAEGEDLGINVTSMTPVRQKQLRNHEHYESYE